MITILPSFFEKWLILEKTHNYQNFGKTLAAVCANNAIFRQNLQRKYVLKS
jgi:hypothetical protein